WRQNLDGFNAVGASLQMNKAIGILGGFCLLAGAVLLASYESAQASPVVPTPITATGTLTSDHCDGGCGPQTGGFGTIKVVSDELGTGGAVGTLAFTVTLINGNNFVTGGQDVTFGFDLAG